jgi:SAM-dependent methyltransferase
MAVQADLTRFSLPSRTFDIILNFYYLERNLWVDYCRWLKPGGILIVETLTQDMLAIQPDIDPAFLLKPGELLLAFNAIWRSWRIARAGRFPGTGTRAPSPAWWRGIVNFSRPIVLGWKGGSRLDIKPGWIFAQVSWRW